MRDRIAYELPTAFGTAKLITFPAAPATVWVTTTRNNAPEFNGAIGGIPFDVYMNLRLVDGRWVWHTVPGRGHPVGVRYFDGRHLSEARRREVRIEFTRAVQAWEDGGRQAESWDYARAARAARLPEAERRCLPSR